MAVNPAAVWADWIRAFNGRDWAAWDRLIAVGSQHPFVALDGTVPDRLRDRDALLAHHMTLARHGKYIRLYTLATLGTTAVTTFRLGDDDGMDLCAVVSCTADGQIYRIYTAKA